MRANIAIAQSKQKSEYTNKQKKGLKSYEFKEGQKVLRRNMVKAGRKGLLRLCSTFRPAIFVMLLLLKVRRNSSAANNAGETRDCLSQLTVKLILIQNDTIDDALTARPQQTIIIWLKTNIAYM